MTLLKSITIARPCVTSDSEYGIGDGYSPRDMNHRGFHDHGRQILLKEKQEQKIKVCKGQRFKW